MKTLTLTGRLTAVRNPDNERGRPDRTRLAITFEERPALTLTVKSGRTVATRSGPKHHATVPVEVLKVHHRRLRDLLHEDVVLTLDAQGAIGSITLAERR